MRLAGPEAEIHGDLCLALKPAALSLSLVTGSDLNILFSEREI